MTLYDDPVSTDSLASLKEINVNVGSTVENDYSSTKGTLPRKNIQFSIVSRILNTKHCRVVMVWRTLLYSVKVTN